MLLRFLVGRAFHLFHLLDTCFSYIIKGILIVTLCTKVNITPLNQTLYVSMIELHYSLVPYANLGGKHLRVHTYLCLFLVF